MIHFEFPTDPYRIGLFHGMLISFAISTLLGIIQLVITIGQRKTRYNPPQNPRLDWPEDGDG